MEKDKKNYSQIPVKYDSKYDSLNIRRILKECFWDYDLSEEEIIGIVESDNSKLKMFLFQKIIANSTNMLKALRIFSKDDLKKLLESYKIPQFNHNFIKRRKDIAEFIFFGKEVSIKELRWET